MDSDKQTDRVTNRVFGTFDTNHDGKIDRAEFATSFRRLDIAPNSSAVVNRSESTNAELSVHALISAESKDESKKHQDEHGKCVTCGNPEPQTTSDHRQTTSGTPEWKQVRTPSNRAHTFGVGWCVPVPVEPRAEHNLLH